MKAKRVAKDTYLTLDTAMVRPVFNEFSIQAEVVTLSGTSTIFATDCFTLVRNTCEFCGNTIGKAIKDSHDLVGQYHKVPIVIENIKGEPFVLIPLMSPRSPLNTWISLHAIEMHKKSTVAAGFTDIHFTNGKVITVNASFSTLNRQLVLANAIRSGFLKRLESREQFFTHPVQLTTPK